MVATISPLPPSQKTAQHIWCMCHTDRRRTHSFFNQ
jgi:hypothetical protein